MERYPLNDTLLIVEPRSLRYALRAPVETTKECMTLSLDQAA